MGLSYDAATGTLNTNNIKDEAGSGAPNFPNGLKSGGTTIPASIRFQQKFLTSSFSNGTATNLSELQFNNLTIGKVYKYTGIFYGTGHATGAAIGVILTDTNASSGIYFSWRKSLASGDTQHIVTYILTATGTTLYTFAFTSGVSVYGESFSPNKRTTNAILEELPLHTQTTAWT